MLTVARMAAEHAAQAAAQGPGALEVLQAALDGARQALADTPNILPVIKQAGVVDAGGQGLVCLFEGFLMGLTAAPEELEELLACLLYAYPKSGDSCSLRMPATA